MLQRYLSIGMPGRGTDGWMEGGTCNPSIKPLHGRALLIRVCLAAFRSDLSRDVISNISVPAAGVQAVLGLVWPQHACSR